MVQTCLFHSFGLGALCEIRIAKALGEAVSLLFCCSGALRKTLAFLTDVDHPLERKRESRFVYNHLGSAGPRERRQLDRIEARQPRDRRIIALEPACGFLRSV